MRQPAVRYLGVLLWVLLTRPAFSAPPVISPEIDLDPSVVTVIARQTQRVPVAANDGTTTLVVWEDYRGPSSTYIYGVRIAADGTLLDPTGFPIAMGSWPHTAPAVAFDGTNFVVAWTDHRASTSDIYAARVRPDGTVLDPGGFALSNDADDDYEPALASDGSQVLVVWCAQVAGPSRGIVGKRLPRGSNVPADAAPLLIANPASNQDQPKVAFGGGNFLVAFRDQRADVGDINAIRVRPDGTTIEASPFSIVTLPELQSEPDLAVGPNGFVVVWRDERNPWPAYDDVYAARVTFTGTVANVNGLPIFTGVNQDISPRIAFDGTNFMIVWYRARDPMPNGYDIVASRVAPDLTVLNTTPLDVTTAHPTNYNPCLVFTGSHYLVAWEAGTPSGELDINISRVAVNGTLMSPNDVNIVSQANNQVAPAAAFNGSRYLAAWDDDRAGSPGIFASFVQTDRTVPGPQGFAISQRPNRVWTYQEGNPAIASDGVDFLVVWGDAVGPTGELRGARVRADGTVVDPQGFLIASGAGRRYWPRVVYDGANYFVAWADTRNGVADIFGARIRRDGTVMDANGIAIAVSAFNKDRPAVAFDGTNYLVAWSEAVPDNTSDDILARRVSSAGAVIDSAAPIAVSSAQGRQFWVEVAFQSGLFLVVWHDHRNGADANIGARVTPSGTVLDPNGITFSAPGSELNVAHVVADGERFVVVWSELRGLGNDLYGVRVNVDGGIANDTLDGGSSQAPFLVAGHVAEEAFPRLASNGTGQVLVSYTRFHPEPGFGSQRAHVRTISEGLLAGGGCVTSAQCETGVCEAGTCVPKPSMHLNVGCNCDSGFLSNLGLTLLAVLSWVLRRSLVRAA